MQRQTMKLYSVRLESVGSELIKTIKEVREATGCGLKEAKDMVEGAPQTVLTNVTLEQAERFKALLVSMGNKVRIVDSAGYEVNDGGFDPAVAYSSRCSKCGGFNVFDAQSGFIDKIIAKISGKKYSYKCDDCGNKW